MKKILSLIVILSIIVCLPCINASAGQSTYGDEAILHLQSLGILDGDILSSDYITRGEFAQVISNITGNREPVAGTYTFYDLAADHPYYSAIQHCVQRGYIGGANGMVRPDDYITYIEAMTIMSRVLNYTDYARYNGDYTRGYYTTAKMLGLLNNSNITSSDEPMSYANAAAMIYNALQCNMNRLAEISPLYYTYVTIDKTLAYEMLSLNHTKGVMTSNGYTDISGNENYGDSLVVVGNHKLSSRNLDIAHRNLLGQEVSVYYDDNNNIVSIAPTSKNTVLTVKRSDFVGVTDRTFKYLENDVERKVKLDSNAPYFLNGVPVLDFNATGLVDAQYADVHLVDNNDDLEYDAVFVNVYETFVVYSVDSQGVVSSMNNDKTVNLGEENGKETVIYDASGNVISAKEISPYNVISVMETEDFVYAICVNNSLSGKVNQIDTYSVIIDDLEFDIPNGTAGYFDGITLGTYVNAYFDFDNRIVHVEKNTNLSSNINYGVIVNCEYDSGFEKELKIKLFTKEGKFEILKTRNKFKINGVSYTTSKLTSIPNEFFEKGKLKHTVILYKLNPENEITEITFAQTYMGEDEDGFIQTFSNYKKSMSANGGYYAKVFTNSSTTFFSIPKDDYSDEDGYAIFTRTSVPTSTTHTLDAFHFSKNNGFADIVVLHGLPVGLNYNTALSVVMKISDGIDKEGNELLRVTHFINNKETISLAKDEVVIEKLKAYKPGDAVRFALLNNEIMDCEKIFDYSTGTFTPSSKAGTYATHSLYNAEGYVVYNDRKLFRLSDKNEKIATSDILQLDGYTYSSTYIMVVESSARGVNVTQGTLDDVKIGSHMVLQSRGAVLKFIVIYKDK